MKFRIKGDELTEYLPVLEKFNFVKHRPYFDDLDREIIEEGSIIINSLRDLFSLQQGVKRPLILDGDEIEICEVYEE